MGVLLPYTCENSKNVHCFLTCYVIKIVFEVVMVFSKVDLSGALPRGLGMEIRNANRQRSVAVSVT